MIYKMDTPPIKIRNTKKRKRPNWFVIGEYKVNLNKYNIDKNRANELVGMDKDFQFENYRWLFVSIYNTIKTEKELIFLLDMGEHEQIICLKFSYEEFRSLRSS